VSTVLTLFDRRYRELRGADEPFRSSTPWARRAGRPATFAAERRA